MKRIEATNTSPKQCYGSMNGTEDGLYDKSWREEGIGKAMAELPRWAANRYWTWMRTKSMRWIFFNSTWNAGERLKECLRGLKHGFSNCHTAGKGDAAVYSPAFQEGDVIDTRARVQKRGNSRSHVRLTCI